MRPSVIFGRRVSVEFGLPGTTGLRFSDLYTTFRVSHEWGSAPSRASIQVYNATSTARDALVPRRAVVRLFAGHGDQERLIFEGTPSRAGVTLRTAGPDRIFDISATDGGLGFQTARVSISVRTGATFGSIVSEILRQTGWARGTIQIDEAFRYPSPLVVAFARPAEVLNRVAIAVGGTWRVRDRQLHILRPGSTSPLDRVPVISAEGGSLLSTPNPTPRGLKLRALLDASMRPGGRFVLRGPENAGTYVARDVTFIGDSGYGTPFYMELVARQEGR